MRRGRRPRQRGDGRPQRPGNAHANVMSPGLIAGSTHVACGTGGGLVVVFAYDPLVFFEIHSFSERVESDAVL